MTKRLAHPPIFLRVVGLSWLALCAVLGVSGCATAPQPAPRPVMPAELHRTYFTTGDGSVLPYRAWRPAAKPRAIVVAVHGFNDYSRFFELPGTFLKHHGIVSYAYDQRGFGGAPRRGYWDSGPALARDLIDFTRSVAREYPDLPVYWLGESMGAAVAIDAATEPDRPPITGMILAAPAVWSRATMPWYQRSLLWLLGNLAPSVRLTGESTPRLPTDNLPILRAFGRDPLIVKETRIDAIVGLADLMDRALGKSSRIAVDTLVLYGQRDQIIPTEPVRVLIAKIPAPYRRAAYYAEGYHLLTRDIQAPRLWDDVLAWMIDRSNKLPSGADALALAWSRQGQRSQ